MASALYNSYKQDMLGRASGIDLDTDTIQAALVDTGTYTFAATHTTRSQLTGVVAATASAALSSKTVTDGVFDAADCTFTAVSGASVEAVVLYKVVGTAATDLLIAYIDGISVTPNGGDIIVSWSSGASRIFRLV